MGKPWQDLLSTLRNELQDGVHLQIHVMGSIWASKRDGVQCAAVVTEVNWCPRASSIDLVSMIRRGVPGKGRTSRRLPLPTSNSLPAKASVAPRRPMAPKCRRMSRIVFISVHAASGRGRGGQVVHHNQATKIGFSMPLPVHPSFFIVSTVSTIDVSSR